MQIFQVDVSSGGRLLESPASLFCSIKFNVWIVLKGYAGTVSLDFIPTHGKCLKVLILRGFSLHPSSMSGQV